MKKLILILIVLAAITEGCKKYPDGPLISFRSAEKRLYGLYDLTIYTVNGVDSLNLYNDSLGGYIDFFYNDVDDVNVCQISRDRKDGIYTSLYWKWQLINKNKTLTIIYSKGSDSFIGTGPFGEDKLPQWEILRLTDTEVNMKTNFNSKGYYIELIERKK